jgi:predicted nucleic acid-binding protein
VKDTDIADGSRCVLDANVLIYAEEGHSKQATALLARCAEGAVSGILPFAALLEVCHKLMLIEARAGNRISGSNPARKLSAQPEVVKSLHAYRAKVDALLNSSI